MVKRPSFCPATGPYVTICCECACAEPTCSYLHRNSPLESVHQGTPGWEHVIRDKWFESSTTSSEILSAAIVWVFFHIVKYPMDDKIIFFDIRMQKRSLYPHTCWYIEMAYLHALNKNLFMMKNMRSIPCSCNLAPPVQ